MTMTNPNWNSQEFPIEIPIEYYVPLLGAEVGRESDGGKHGERHARTPQGVECCGGQLAVAGPGKTKRPQIPFPRQPYAYMNHKFPPQTCHENFCFKYFFMF